MIRVERTYPAPPCLAIEKAKPNGTYRCAGVIPTLKSIFHNKCYICEMGDLQDPEVEHRIPHGGCNKDLEFDWDNLFWACRNCNDIKNQRNYYEGIIDCCHVDPELLLNQEVKEGRVNVTVIGPANDIVVNNTAMLLNEVFNKDNTDMRKARQQERYRLLLKEMNCLYSTLEKYDNSIEPAKAFYYKILEGLLDRKSAFSAFKRQYIRNNRIRYPGLQQLLI